MTTTTTTTPTYTGWARSPGQRWRRLCQADSLLACWAQVLAHPQESPHEERLVLPTSPRRGRAD
jgi:hypothetical protein